MEMEQRLGEEVIGTSGVLRGRRGELRLYLKQPLICSNKIQGHSVS